MTKRSTLLVSEAAYHKNRNEDFQQDFVVVVVAVVTTAVVITGFYEHTRQVKIFDDQVAEQEQLDISGR